jgi:ABC-type multidrug transport system fused ATPase/permease subunit
LSAARCRAAASRGGLANNTDVRERDATRRLLSLIAPYRAQAALALVLAALGCLLNFPLPLLIQELVDHSVTAGGLSPVLVLGLLGVFAAQAMIAVALTQVIGPLGLGVVRDLRHALYARLQRLGLPFYDQTPAGAIISRLMDDVAVVKALITSQALAILTDLGSTFVVLGLLVTRGAGMALAVVLVLAGYGTTFLFFSRRIRAGSTEVRHRLDRIFSQLKERIDAVLIVKAYARGCGDRRVPGADRRGAQASAARRLAGGGVLEPERGPERGRDDAGPRGRGHRGLPGADVAR